MEQSILNTIKKMLGLDESYTAFDTDIIVHINSAFFTLNQIGVGPPGGFEISGKDDIWESFLEGRKDLNSVKTYIYLKVRVLFDPPETSHAREAFIKQSQEYEWRLLAQETANS